MGPHLALRLPFSWPYLHPFSSFVLAGAGEGDQFVSWSWARFLNGACTVTRATFASQQLQLPGPPPHLLSLLAAS